jgi:hypothetical protein
VTNICSHNQSRQMYITYRNNTEACDEKIAKLLGGFEAQVDIRLLFLARPDGTLRRVQLPAILLPGCGLFLITARVEVKCYGRGWQDQRLWCKLKPLERSIKLRVVSDELASRCECRHCRIAPAELARLELPLLDLLC